MGITTRDLTEEDAGAVAALKRRIEADHPTGFCLGAGEVLQIMRGHPDAAFEGAFDGDHLVAYTALLAGRPGEDGQAFRLYGDVDPARLGEGLGTLMLDRQLARARAKHAEAAPSVPARYVATALAGRDDQGDLLAANGMSPGRHAFMMVADLSGAAGGPPRAQLPDDVRVGPFDPATGDELRAAHLAAFADAPGFAGMSPELWAMFVVDADHARHALSAVARAGDGSIAAYVLAHEYAVPLSGGPGPEISVPYVGTVPAHRGRGLATGLLSRVLHAAREAGFPAASLSVDTENPTGALRIYERAGFRQAYRQDHYHLDE